MTWAIEQKTIPLLVPLYYPLADRKLIPLEPDWTALTINTIANKPRYGQIGPI